MTHQQLVDIAIWAIVGRIECSVCGVPNCTRG